MNQPLAVTAQDRAREAERRAVETQQFATLGRYVAEMRHSFNNAMTCLLGNAELLLQTPGGLTGRPLEQLQTIRTMALRMHQMVQRFSALETELQTAEDSTPVEKRPSKASSAR